MNNNLFHVIKDPVHGTMQFSTLENNWVKPFINSAHLQRLRFVKQMGMGDYIFPGAVHTRFSHSLGCCYTGSQIAQKIGLEPNERQIVMIACLIHDIGHGPFSHAFEDLFHSTIRHEAWTPHFLKDYVTEKFFYTYNQINKKYPLDETIFTQIANMIMHLPVEKRILADIVSSQLDADRLDYLLRDSHFCGVRYGEFDFRWMLHCLAIIPSAEGARLGITHKGIGAVEHYLMARRLMTRNIYKSQKKLAFENFLINLLKYLAKDLGEYAFLKPILQTNLGKFLIAAHQFNQDVLSHKELLPLKKAFIKNNFANYQSLRDDDIFFIIRYLAKLSENHPVVQLAERLEYRMMPKVVRLDHVNLTEAQTILAEFQHAHANLYQAWQIALIQTPHRAYMEEEDPILVINEHQQIRPISEYSFILNAISDKLEHVALLAVDREIANEEAIQKLIIHLLQSR